MSGRDPDDRPDRGPPDGPPGQGGDQPGRGPPGFVRERQAKRSVERQLREKKNVHAVAVGRKVTEGRETDEPAIIVHVTEKEPEENLEKKDRIPRRIKVVGEGGRIKSEKTDVKQTEIPTYDSASVTAPRWSMHRPVVGGTMIMPQGGAGWGTLGAVVETAGGELRLLTNSHVVNNDGISAGDPIVQPNDDTAVVGSVETWSSRSETEPNTDDSALISLDAEVEAANHILSVGPLGPSTTVTVGDTCIVMGARTYGMASRVAELDYSGLVQASDGTLYEYEGIIRFDPPVTRGGDSGAVWGVYDEENDYLRPAGLHFAGSRLAIPWDQVEATHGPLTPPSSGSVIGYNTVSTVNVTEVVPYTLETGSRAILKCLAARYGHPGSPTDETVRLRDGPVVDGSSTGDVIGSVSLDSSWGEVVEVEFGGLVESLGVGTHTISFDSTYAADKEYSLEIVAPTEHRLYGTVTTASGEVIDDATVSTYRT